MGARRTLLNKQGQRPKGVVALCRQVAPVPRGLRMASPHGSATPSRQSRAIAAIQARIAAGRLDQVDAALA